MQPPLQPSLESSNFDPVPPPNSKMPVMPKFVSREVSQCSVGSKRNLMKGIEEVWSADGSQFSTLNAYLQLPETPHRQNRNRSQLGKLTSRNSFEGFSYCRSSSEVRRGDTGSL